MDAALDYIFRTRRRLDGAPRGLDEYTRDTAPTRSLLQRARLLETERDYIVVTGSRGKGSVCAILSKVLEAFDRRVGMLTSPHLLHWTERIRVNGAMMPAGDFLRILAELQPHIDAALSALTARQYLSPQGIFLAIALRYFDERGADAAVLEVGRGGRFDDVAAVPNALALFAPIMREHTAFLGDSLARIAWHKAGIISPGSRAISLPQAPSARAQLEAEAARQHARLTVLAEADVATWVADYGGGQRLRLPPYGELTLPLLGRYQLQNATLAIRAAELLLGKRARESAAKETIKSGLERARWLGRVQQLDSKPAIFVDGAITPASARSFVESLRGRISEPVVAIVGIPQDRDFAGVYAVMAAASSALIITETDINPSTRFPPRAAALAAARGLQTDAHYRARLPAALALAREIAGTDGTILLAVSLMLVGECMLLWQVDTSVI